MWSMGHPSRFRTAEDGECVTGPNNAAATACRGEGGGRAKTGRECALRPASRTPRVCPAKGRGARGLNGYILLVCCTLRHSCHSLCWHQPNHRFLHDMSSLCGAFCSTLLTCPHSSWSCSPSSQSEDRYTKSEYASQTTCLLHKTVAWPTCTSKSFFTMRHTIRRLFKWGNLSRISRLPLLAALIDAARLVTNLMTHHVRCDLPNTSISSSSGTTYRPGASSRKLRAHDKGYLGEDAGSEQHVKMSFIYRICYSAGAGNGVFSFFKSPTKFEIVIAVLLHSVFRRVCSNLCIGYMFTVHCAKHAWFFAGLNWIYALMGNKGKLSVRWCWHWEWRATWTSKPGECLKRKNPQSLKGGSLSADTHTPRGKGMVYQRNLHSASACAAYSPPKPSLIWEYSHEQKGSDRA